MGVFTAQLRTAGTQTLTATDSAAASITGASNPITVTPASATHFGVFALANATAGTAFVFLVTAEDLFNNIAINYTGTVHFSSSDGQAQLPQNGTLTSGVEFFAAILTTTGSQTLTAVDVARSTLTGSSGAITVAAAPGAATHFAVSAPANATAGTATLFTATAENSANSPATAYTGTVAFTSSDGGASTVLAARSTLVSGIGTFSATLTTAGGQSLIATDTSTTSVSGTTVINVSAAATSHFGLRAPATAITTSDVNFTVTALDPFNNTTTNYTGMVTFTSSDTAVGVRLPGNSTLSNGVGLFGATFQTAGSQILTATDTVTNTINGSTAINVISNAAIHFVVSGPPSTTVGTTCLFTVTAETVNNTTDFGYAGTVTFTSSDRGANTLLPHSGTLTNGVGTFSATLTTAATQTVTASDVTTSSITGTSGAIVVSAGPATHFHIAINVTSTAAGTGVVFTVSALDQYNNLATSFNGTVSFSSSDTGASTVLPAPASLTSGIGVFSATLTTAGTQTVRGTNQSSNVSGVSSPFAITVSQQLLPAALPMNPFPSYVL